MARSRGVRTGFIGLTCSKLPQLFRDHADFVVIGEPEAAIQRLAQGEPLAGDVASPEISDLDSLPFPRWNVKSRSRWWVPFAGRPYGGGFPLLASRGCPEFCTYCPHRILADYRARSVANIIDELGTLCDAFRRPYVIFRDPLFSQQRDRAMALADEIRARKLDLRFECETRLDRLDPELVDALHAAGLRAMSFGVESMDPHTLKPILARGSGGLSGPTLKPVALATVHACYAATQLPIVGMGGIATAQDVVEFVACGALHVALGTVLFADPDAPTRIREELAVVPMDDKYGAAHMSEKPLEFAAKALA